MGIALLAFINALSSIGVIVILFGLISFANIGTAPEGKEWIPLIIIIALVLALDVLKWLAYVRVSFKSSRAWLVFYLFYTVLLISVTLLLNLSLLVLMVLFYVIAILLLYYENRS